VLTYLRRVWCGDSSEQQVEVETRTKETKKRKETWSECHTLDCTHIVLNMVFPPKDLQYLLLIYHQTNVHETKQISVTI